MQPTRTISRHNRPRKARWWLFFRTLAHEITIDWPAPRVRFRRDNESEVMLARGANAPIIGFNVRASKQARALVEYEGVVAPTRSQRARSGGTVFGLYAEVERKSRLRFWLTLRR